MPAKKGVPNPNAGRKKGSVTVNTTSPDIKVLTRKHAGMCVEQLIRIAQKSKSEFNRLSAISQILDRGFGRPSQQVDHGNANDKPLVFTLDLGRD